VIDETKAQQLITSARHAAESGRELAPEVKALS
jgi:hypothetical protein